jgi:hypothetical protein
MAYQYTIANASDQNSKRLIVQILPPDLHRDENLTLENYEW